MLTKIMVALAAYTLFAATFTFVVVAV